MEHLSELQKLQITLDIVKKLRTFEGPNGKVNLFNNEYSFVKELKKIFSEYIHSDRAFKGQLEFKEIGKIIEYYLPCMNNKNPLFVIRM
jgi:hypothetical protein